MKAKISEIRTAAVLVFITIAVCVAGLLLYRNLSFISDEVSASYKKQAPPSETVRELVAEFRDADNYIKSYNLTHDDDYLVSFFKSASLIEEKTGTLKKKENRVFKNKVIIDSIVLLTEQRFDLMKKQLFMDDEKNVTNELNVISRKISETKKPAAPIARPKDTVTEEKSNFFNRLFGKKKKNKAVVMEEPAQRPKTQKELDSIAAEIDATVQYVKQRQFSKIQNRQNIELQSETEGKRIIDRIHLFYLQLEKIEKAEAQTKIQAAKHKVNQTKNLGILVSVIISALLLIVSWFIIFYSRRKAEYENALLKAKQEAEELAKTKEMFLANMSHEIKTPLNAIYGFTDQVLRSNIPSEQKEQLSVVKKSATHLINLITDILSYSKIQSGHMKLELSDFDLREELKEIGLLFKPIADKKNIHFSTEISYSAPKYIQGDLTKLKQVLMNIIGNAIKFTEYGYVKLSIEKDEANKADHLLSIVVSDTGIGIPKDKLPGLFNEYEQAHADLSQKYGGTGLGLVITKKLVELMGGIIKLESEENKGTRVFITIPFAEGSEPEKKVNGNVPAIDTSMLRSKKVLIADDEEYNRLLLKTILSKYQVQVMEAADGAEAVDAVKSNTFDMVLMDLNMPVKNGIEACKEIRRLPGMDKEHLAILVSSAAQQDEETEELKSAGFNGSLFKPFTEEELLHKLLHFTHTPQEGTFTAPKQEKKVKAGKLSFSNIESIANGDDQFKKEMISIFHRSINQGTEQLAEACSRQKWKEVSDLAHKMMPPCKHFEANELYTILAFFENIRQHHTDPALIEKKLEELKKELEAVNSELEIYL